jgi:hypothetical protein
MQQEGVERLSEIQRVWYGPIQMQQEGVERLSEIQLVWPTADAAGGGREIVRNPARPTADAAGGGR